MESKKELETTIRVAKARRGDLLNSDKGTDLEYIRDLQTLTQLITAAEKKLPTAI